MMDVLIHFPDPEYAELVQFFTEGQLGLKARTVSSVEEAIEQINQSADGPAWVVCDYRSTAKVLVPHLLKRGLKSQVLFRVPADKVDAMNAKTQDSFCFADSNQLLTVLQERVAPLRSSGNLVGGESEFAQAKPEFLLSVSQLPADLFAQLSNSKYAKVARAGQSFSLAELEYFKKTRKQDYLWIRRPDLQLFLEAGQKKFFVPPVEVPQAVVTPQAEPVPEAAVQSDPVPVTPALPEVKVEFKTELKPVAQPEVKPVPKPVAQSKVDVPTQAKVEERVAAPIVKPPSPESKTIMSLDRLRSMMQDSGITPEVQVLAKKNMAQALTQVKKAPRLSDLIQYIQKSRDSYLSGHSILLGFLSCSVASQMEWSSDTTYQKLILSSFLHDVAVKDDRLARIRRLKELEPMRTSLSAAEFQKMLLTVRDHPLKGAELARGFNEVPPDVDLVIAQHHELPDGTGFPKGLTSTRIGPLAAVFIVVHDWVDFILADDSASSATPRKVVDSISEFVQSRQSLYATGNFRKVLGCLNKIKI